jgi:peptidoglycan/LPS O-acetylase OafA/YrhL
MHALGSAGASGVDLFFVISGFIMVTMTWHEFGRRNASKRFLVRRIDRIYPPYWIALAASLAMSTLFPAALHAAPLDVASLTTSILLFHRPADRSCSRLGRSNSRCSSI